MTMRMIKSMLQAAIFTGAVALPMAALADTDAASGGAEATDKVPDHAQAEARTAGDASGSSGVTRSEGVPDHAQAEPGTDGDASGASGVTRDEGVPDHAAAEARGAAEPTGE
jgi:hypothetical protein